MRQSPDLEGLTQATFTAGIKAKILQSVPSPGMGQ